MNRKTIAERYEDLSRSRILEAPRDKDEQEYADLEADQEAQRIWQRLEGAPQHRKRTIMRLAQEALERDPGKETISGDSATPASEESLLR